VYLRGKLHNKSSKRTKADEKHALMHELGHHATLPAMEGITYNSFDQAGHYEAEADNYADRHQAKGQFKGLTGYDQAILRGDTHSDFEAANLKNRVQPAKKPKGPSTKVDVIMARDYKNRDNEEIPGVITGDQLYERVHALTESRKTRGQRAPKNR
jgi:hypothetical protein